MCANLQSFRPHLGLPNDIFAAHLPRHPAILSPLAPPARSLSLSLSLSLSPRMGRALASAAQLGNQIHEPVHGRRPPHALAKLNFEIYFFVFNFWARPDASSAGQQVRRHICGAKNTSICGRSSCVITSVLFRNCSRNIALFQQKIESLQLDA